MENKEVGSLAREYYLKGFGFAESILHAINDVGIINAPDALLRASTGFSTGFGGKGSTCGAITGPIMAVGLKYGRLKPEESLKDTYKHSKKVVNIYEQRYKTTECACVTRVWRE